jgi:hypothetical protein
MRDVHQFIAFQKSENHAQATRFSLATVRFMYFLPKKIPGEFAYHLRTETMTIQRCQEYPNALTIHPAVVPQSNDA